MRITIEKIQELINKAKDIEEAVNDFFTKVEIIYSPMPSGVIGFSDHRWVDPTDDILDSQIKALESYERWYAVVQKIVSEANPDRMIDMKEMYEKNRDILELEKSPWENDKSPFQGNFLRNLSKQKSILDSLRDLDDDGLINCGDINSNENSLRGQSIHIVNQNQQQQTTQNTVIINQEIKLGVDKAIQSFEAEMKKEKPDKSIVKKSLGVIKKGADYGFGKLIEVLLKRLEV